ncbi:hypothetical protein B2G71_05595 [Novosphingobium sp. PC22D]|uniref:hypothetical protein n=1 Tax=Novosphingobium sp. PC22D TaxID=1962403 RepID=UPI000BF1833A|nr:hypothetical protein [Novosphingobium sp. PC22D]PEQ13786.1 hypothetical protein B2G71_05595 [Novosphingobium sp. PC22D]
MTTDIPVMTDIPTQKLEEAFDPIFFECFTLMPVRFMEMMLAWQNQVLEMATVMFPPLNPAAVVEMATSVTPPVFQD